MSNALSDETLLTALLGELRNRIVSARQSALRAVDAIQVQTCWEIGRHIVEFEQGGATRAAYGKRLLPQLAETLTAKFGSGFDTTNLRKMRQFYLTFSKRDALRRELGWTHYRSLMRAFYSAFPIRNALRTELRLILPSEEELRQELEWERARLT